MLHQLAAPLAALSEFAGRGRRYEAVTRNFGLINRESLFLALF
jgi:hypothetical protein